MFKKMIKNYLPSVQYTYQPSTLLIIANRAGDGTDPAAATELEEDDSPVAAASVDECCKDDGGEGCAETDGSGETGSGCGCVLAGVEFGNALVGG